MSTIELTNKGSVFCFGELLLRMSPELGKKWIQQNRMPTFIGGAELNVATALANWKIPARYGTALPDNYLSKEIAEEIMAKRIDVSAIHYSGERIGIYYLPQGADLKNAGVIYDRAYSSFASLTTGMIDWDKALAGCCWFHFSAISPALNENVVAVCKEGLEAATRLGLKISIDLNYRAKLWKYGKYPVEVMPELAAYCDLIMGNIWSAAQLLSTTLHAPLLEKDEKTAYLQHARETAAEIRSKFPRCKMVANTFRFDVGEGVRYYAALDSAQEQFVSTELVTGSVVDKIGSGDCFMGGLIYGFYHGHSTEQIINYAAAAAFGKLQEKSDATSQKIEQVHEILKKYGAPGIYH